MKNRGSMTVEAALVLPLSFFAIYIFLCFFLQLQLQLAIQEKLTVISGKLAKYGAVYGYFDERSQETTSSFLQELGFDKMAGYISDSVYLALCMEKEMEDEECIRYVAGGSNGFDFRGSTIYGTDGVIDICVSYAFRRPFSLFSVSEHRITQRVKTRAFQGNQLHGTKNEGESETNMVFVSEKGEVFHTNQYCTYLKLSVRKVSALLIDQERNASGGRYYPCRICRNSPAGTNVFITAYGTSYHTNLECSEIYRNISKISREEAEAAGMRKCSKCAKGEGT